MTSPHTAVRAESLVQHYREVRARLYGPRPSSVIRRHIEPPAPVEVPAPVKPFRHARDFIFIKPRAAGINRPGDSQGGIWNNLAAEIIIQQTAAEHGVTAEQIKGYARARVVVAARFETYCRLQKELEYSLPMIGKTIGGRDHSGVLHGIRRHQAAERGKVYRQPVYGKALEAAGL